MTMRRSYFKAMLRSALLLLILEITSYPRTCQGSLMFVAEPENATVFEGETVTFECDFRGSDLTPSWQINKVIYYSTSLQPNYVFNDQDFSLTVKNVSRQLNGYTFQCIVGQIASAQGFLFVESHPINTVQTGPVDLNGTVQCQRCTEAVTVIVSTDENNDIDNVTSYQLKSDIPVIGTLIAATVCPGVIITSCFLTILAIVLYKKVHRKSKMKMDIATEENDAYGIFERKVRNEHQQRAVSPQA